MFFSWSNICILALCIHCELVKATVCESRDLFTFTHFREGMRVITDITQCQHKNIKAFCSQNREQHPIVAAYHPVIESLEHSDVERFNGKVIFSEWRWNHSYGSMLSTQLHSSLSTADLFTDTDCWIKQWACAITALFGRNNSNVCKCRLYCIKQKSHLCERICWLASYVHNTHS